MYHNDVYLTTGEKFKQKDGYYCSICAIEIPIVDDEGAKTGITTLKCLAVYHRTKKNPDPRKARYYPLSHVISFGDKLKDFP